MSIEIADNFKYKGKLPNFARDNFLTLDEMVNCSENDFDNGHISYCAETRKHYVFNRNNTVDEELGLWRLLSNDPIEVTELIESKADKIELDKKVDKVDGYSLVNNELIRKIGELENYDDSVITEDIKKIKTKLEGKADSSTLATHTNNNLIHITDEERQAWNNKVSPEEGKGLSTNDFTNEYKQKLDDLRDFDDEDIARSIAAINNSLAQKISVETFREHADNNDIHITANERTKWNNKIDQTALNSYATKTYVTDTITNIVSGGTINIDGYAKTDYVNSELAKKADKVSFDEHINNDEVHVNGEDKNRWDAKLDVDDLDGYAKTIDVNVLLNNKVDKVEGKSLISNTEIERLRGIENYNDTEIRNAVSDVEDKLSKKANVSDLTSHINDVTKHITEEERRKWNNKVDKETGYSLISVAEINRLSRVDNYNDTELRGKISSIESRLGNYASSNDLDTHINDSRKHISDTERSKWNGIENKVDKVDGKGLSTNDYTNGEVVKVGKIKIDGSEKEFLAANGTYIGLYTKGEIDHLLYPLLNPYKAPTVVLSPDKTIFEIGTTNTVRFTATITKGRDNIKKVTFKKGANIAATINDPTSMTQEFSDTLNTTTTVSVIVNDGTNDVSESVTINFVKKSFYGIVDAMVTNSTITSGQIKALNSFLSTTKVHDYNSININNKKIVYAYDKSKGKLSSILDGNGFDMLRSYTMSELTIDGTNYYVYILTSPTTVTNYKQSFK